MSIKEMYEHLDDFPLTANLMSQPAIMPTILTREQQEVAARQIDICERLIAENLRQKEKEARPHTERLRALVSLNQLVIKENLKVVTV
jgi:hypothetical protein